MQRIDDVALAAAVVAANGMDDEYDEYAVMISRRRTMGRTRAAAVGWRGGGWQRRRGDGRDHDVASSYAYDDDAKMDAGGDATMPRQHPSVNIDSAGWLHRVVVTLIVPEESTSVSMSVIFRSFRQSIG